MKKRRKNKKKELLETRKLQQYLYNTIETLVNGRDEHFKPIYIDGLKTEYVIGDKGTVFSVKRKKRLNPELNHGYERVVISMNGKKIHKRVHRLVAEAFLENPNNFPTVRHIDDNKRHNYVENLMWGLLKDNSADALNNGKYMRGEDHKNAVYTETDVRNVCKCLEDNELTADEIAKKCHVKKSLITNIIHNNEWKEISDDYKISNYNKFKKSGSRQLTKAQVIDVLTLLKEGIAPIEVSRRLNIPVYTVRDINQQKVYKPIIKEFNGK